MARDPPGAQFAPGEGQPPILRILFFPGDFLGPPSPAAAGAPPEMELFEKGGPPFFLAPQKNKKYFPQAAPENGTPFF